MASNLLWILLAISAAAAAAAAAAPPAKQQPREADEELMPIDLFPLMKPWQRCLYFCNYCFKTPAQTVELLHCANSWCLTDLMKSGSLPKEATAACPLMELLR